MMENNLARYNNPEVVDFYVTQSDLQEVEKVLFDRHLMSGMAVLDIGVGGGRTTPYLARLAGKYVGIDFSGAMVEACRSKFPGLEFITADATDMHMIPDATYDAVVFSFNGIDTIRSDEGRARCLREINRSLKPGGIYIFSSHNAKILAVWPVLRTAQGRQIPWRIVRAFFKSFLMAWRGFSSGVYFTGKGYIRDPVHGGMDHYTSTPHTMQPQLEEAGFEVIVVMGGPYPEVSSPIFTPWHYYACRKVQEV